jgi:hypothetical protein
MAKFIPNNVMHAWIAKGSIQREPRSGSAIFVCLYCLIQEHESHATFHYERSPQVSYNTVLPGRFSVPGERSVTGRLVTRHKETQTRTSARSPLFEPKISDFTGQELMV